MFDQCLRQDVAKTVVTPLEPGQDSCNKDNTQSKSYLERQILADASWAVVAVRSELARSRDQTDGDSLAHPASLATASLDPILRSDRAKGAEPSLPAASRIVASERQLHR